MATNYATYTGEHARLTPTVVAKALNDNPGVTLGTGFWMKRQENKITKMEEIKVCAVTLLTIHEKGLVRAERLTTSHLDDISKELSVPRDYLEGLLRGFETYEFPADGADNHWPFWVGALEGSVARGMIEGEEHWIHDYLDTMVKLGYLQEGD